MTIEIGSRCEITTQFSLDSRKTAVQVIRYLGNRRYEVQGTDTVKNRYIRFLEIVNGEIVEAGIDKIKALLMDATDIELEQIIEFAQSQIDMMHKAGG